MSLQLGVSNEASKVDHFNRKNRYGTSPIKKIGPTSDIGIKKAMAKQKNSYFLKSDLSVTEGDSQSTTSSTFTLVRLGETTLIKKVIKKYR